MPSDVAIQELLYAILKQKCLKDIDWHAVAADPILTQTITNGHAARMRYSRFKKQMDKARENPPPVPPLPSPRRGRNSNNGSIPRRSRVEKNESPKKNKCGSAVLKAEASSSFQSQASSSLQSQSQDEEDNEEQGGEREGTADSTADIPTGMKTSLAELSRIKRERVFPSQTSSSSSPSAQARLLAATQYGLGQDQTRPQNQHQNQASSSKCTETQDAYISSPALMTPMTTPRYCVERSTSPSPCPDHAVGRGGNHQMSFSTNDDYTGSFEINSQSGMTSTGGLPSSVLFGEYGNGLGMGMNMGMGMGMDLGLGNGMGMGGGAFEDDGIWGLGGSGGVGRGEVDADGEEDEGNGNGNGKVAVKVEPRWEEGYRG